MLVKMHACAVSVYQALSKEPGYEARNANILAPYSDMAKSPWGGGGGVTAPPPPPPQCLCNWLQLSNHLYRLVLHYIFKAFRPRLCYVCVHIMLIVGSILMADWQAFGEDNCRIFSPFHFHNNTSVVCKHTNLYNYCIEMQTAAESDNLTAQASELCLATEGCR